MKITLARIGNDRTVEYAFDELIRLLGSMDKHIFIDGRVYDKRDESRRDILWLGLDGSVDASDDDAVLIDVKNGAGIITASNPRSVLIAVYRFMYELGCRFLRPGRDGEHIPARVLDEATLSVSVSERASYRHRGMCIEGAVTYEHVRNMIDWLPKVGMNGYFMQFHIPSAFFKRFYNEPNPYLDKIHVTDEDVAHIWRRLEDEIIKRGLDYHATGHGWTCEPFGITGTGWDRYDGELPEDVRRCMALVNGKREVWQRQVLNTNLCYSSSEVRNTMTDAIVAYCKAHPAVNYLHFWLADGSNNHCECDECKKQRPSDWYVMLLNELDEKLTAEGITTKIVALIYVDLLWEPEVQKIKNQDRFVLMFAPITRTYTTAFADFDASERAELPPYERNRLTMPTSVAENVERLKRWKDGQLQGDSFDFDYHLMWDHYTDPGYYECSRILHRDMANLEKIGLNGMVSCQTQRAAFPTGLPMYSMAKALWDKSSVFTDVTGEYYTAAFGDDAEAVETYLKELSRLFCPPYLRGEKPCSAEQMIGQCHEAKRVINAFDAEYIKRRADDSTDWKHLEYHADICRLYADAVMAYIGGDADERKACIDALDDYIYRTERELHEYFDVFTFRRIYGRYLQNL